MKKKNIFLSLLCLIMVFVLTGCGKKAISTGEFTSITGSENYTTVDVISQYSSYDYIKEATVAKSSEGFQIEFYVLDNADTAKEMFELNKTTFEGYKTGSASQTSLSTPNRSTYKLITDGYYMYLSRIDNTLLYIRVLEKYANSVKDIVDKLGY